MPLGEIDMNKKPDKDRIFRDTFALIVLILIIAIVCVVILASVKHSRETKTYNGPVASHDYSSVSVAVSSISASLATDSNNS